MPTYTYECENGHEFTVFHQRISQGRRYEDCPKCGAEAPRKISGTQRPVVKGGTPRFHD